MKEARLLEIINGIRGKKNLAALQELKAESSLRNDLGFSSLDLAELTVRLEDAFGVDIFQEKIIQTVDEILEQL